ncbi:hypothetical protein ACIQUD_14995 [Streptomyces globisporus]|uniref:hypothetical protein n=1 Tax=Streptomyces globisporus TaxID=1908 RepID=UPI00380DA17B
MTDTPMTPDSVRTDALQPDDQIRHPHDWALITVSSVETLDSLGSPLDFHNRKTDEMERGLRVTGTDADGETVHVDCAPSYLWHREGRRPTTPVTPDAALTRLRQYGERTSAWSTATYNDGTEKALHQIAVSLAAEVLALRSRVAELTDAPVDEAAEMAEADAELEAMRREHPAPCRVPDSPDCTCPLTAEQALRIERDRPETRTTHDCNLPLTRRLDCGHCPHEVCQDCDRCPHTCECNP